MLTQLPRITRHSCFSHSLIFHDNFSDWQLLHSVTVELVPGVTASSWVLTSKDVQYGVKASDLEDVIKAGKIGLLDLPVDKYPHPHPHC